MKFRKLNGGDAEDLLVLFKQLTKKEVILDIDGLLADPNYHNVVVESGGKIIGFGSISIYRAAVQGIIGAIHDIVVDGDYWGRGLGKEIMKRLILKAESRRVKSINLTSNPKRAAARKMYLSLGFEIKDTGYFEKKLD